MISQHWSPSTIDMVQTHAAVAEKTSILLALVKILNKHENSPVKTTTKTILIKNGFTK